MRKIAISDMTLQKLSSSLSFKEKIEIARQLDNLKVDCIYMPKIENSATDPLYIKTVSAFTANSRIAVVTGLDMNDVNIAVSALSAAKKSRLTIAVPVSSTQMEYSYHKKAPKMLELVCAVFETVAGKFESLELCAVDATRADPDFLKKVIKKAVECGFDTVTLCDDEGVMMPDEFFDFVRGTKENIKELDGVNIGICCKDTYGMAATSSLMAIKAGAVEIRCACGKNELPKPDAFAEIVRVCGEKSGFYADINFDQIHRIAKQIEWICGGDHGDKVKEIAVLQKEETVFDIDDSQSDVKDAVKRLGYDLSDEDHERVYEEFSRLAKKKKQVTEKDLDAIVASTALQIPPTYCLESYIINSGNTITSSAQIKLKKDGKELLGVSVGDGPVDASFHAIEQIIGHHFELDDFSIQSVTQGREAIGSALIRLRNGGKVYSGKGISTDIIGASIRAYINAVNKAVYEEANR